MFCNPLQGIIYFESSKRHSESAACASSSAVSLQHGPGAIKRALRLDELQEQAGAPGWRPEPVSRFQER